MPEAPFGATGQAPVLALSLREGHGLARLTPISNSEHDADRHSLAPLFDAKFCWMRPQLRITPLAQTPGAIDRASLTRACLKMYETFATTGVMERDALAKLRGVCGALFRAA